MNIDLSNLTKMLNPVFYPAFKFKGRFLVLYGGSGSGKSYTAADKLIIRTMKENKHNILCVRDTGKSVTKSQFPLIEGEIKRWGLYDQFKINKSIGNELITFPLNGNKIIFSGLDDVEKLKSIYDISSIWIEEANEVRVEDFRELNRRLRGYKGKNKDGSLKYMQIILTFNPVSELSWLKTRFWEESETTKIIYGTKEAAGVGAGDLDLMDTLIIHSTAYDNKFIDAGYIQELENLRKYDQDEYNVYCLGNWGIPGGTYFPKRQVNDRIREIRNLTPLSTGYFDFAYNMQQIAPDSIHWVEDADGYVKIYEQPKPGYPYVGGGDTAGEGSDYNTGYFTNNITGADAATIRCQYDEDLYARQMYCLGKYYNDALLGIETNFSTHPNKELERLGYTRLYVREEAPDAYTGKLVKRYGFNTNKLTRPLMLGMLRTLTRETPELLFDIDLLLEMTTFVKNEKGKPEAADNTHDDMIMARAINCYISDQQIKTIDFSCVGEEEYDDEDEYSNLAVNWYN